MKKALITVSLILLSASLFAQTHWNTVSNDVSFTIKNAGVKVAGHFGAVKTSIVFDPQHLAASSISGSVDVTSISTGIKKRDDDLQDNKYFNSSQFKQIEIKSTKLYAKGSQFAGMFNVTIKGVTKQMELPFQYTSQGNEAEFKSDFSLDRTNFGVGGGGMIMGKNVSVHVDIKCKS